MIGGKTGTAETLPRGNNQYVVSFMGYAPADDPEIAIYVVVDRPNVFIQDDAKYATRIVRKILTEVLPVLNIFMTEELSDSEREELDELHIQLKMPQKNFEEEEQLLDEEGNPIDPGEEREQEDDGNEETPEERENREVWRTFPLDPETGYLKDPNTGYLYDPESGSQVYGGSLLGKDEVQNNEGEDEPEENNPEATE